MLRFAFATSVVLAIVASLWTPLPAETGVYTLADLDRMEQESSDAALAWLARRQNESGSWSSSSPAGHPLERLYEADCGQASEVMATSCALMAFLGAGNSPWKGAYQETVRRGHTWLVKQLDEQGCLLRGEDGEAGGSLSERERWARKAAVARMNQLWGTLALMEVVASVEVPDASMPVSDADKVKRRKVVEPSAQKALAYVSLDPGEKKDKRMDFLNEQTVTMEELVLVGAVRHNAEKNRMARDKDYFESAVPLLKKIQTGATEAITPYRYTDEGEYWFRGTVSTPQAMIAYYYLRIPGARRHMDAAGPLLLAHPPVWNPYYEVQRPTGHPEAGTDQGAAMMPAELKRLGGAWKDQIANEYSWYWQAMTFRSMGGKEWNQWRESVVPVLHRNQRKGGPEAGSWDPAGPHARAFGREIATAWLAMTLQSKSWLQMARTKWEELKDDPRKQAREENLKGQKVERVPCTVCGIDTMTNSTFSKGRGADIYYFCSHECEQKFEMNPEPYLKGSTVEKPKDGEGSEGSHK